MLPYKFSDCSIYAKVRICLSESGHHTNSCLAFPPVLLERKAQQIRKSMDAEKGPYREVRSVFDGADRQSVSIYFYWNGRADHFVQVAAPCGEGACASFRAVRSRAYRPAPGYLHGIHLRDTLP